MQALTHPNVCRNGCGLNRRLAGVHCDPLFENHWESELMRVAKVAYLSVASFGPSPPHSVLVASLVPSPPTINADSYLVIDFDTERVG